MDKCKIDRINELAKKAKTPDGLTDAERAEQAALRAEYLEEWRRNTLAGLDNTYIQTPDGEKRKLQRKDS